FPALMMGACGAVPATGNIAPQLLVAIYEKFRNGDLEGSKAAQRRLNPIRLGLTLGTPPGGVKDALRQLGKSLGPSRLPVAPLSSDKEQKMRAALKEAGLL